MSLFDFTNFIFQRYEGGREEEIRGGVRNAEKKTQRSQTCKLKCSYGYKWPFLLLITNISEQLHHPGSKQQLEEVWEKQDHMENQEFNPKTFFYLHGNC